MHAVIPSRSLISRRRGLLALLAAPLAGCSGSALLDAVVARDSYRGRAGVAYGSEPRQVLDVFRPLVDRRAAPLVVFFYGGSWTRGERADYRFVGEALAAHGVAALVADYRLSPQVRYPDFLADCAQAVKWAFDHSAELGADRGRVFLMGHSAGAYNAAMLALDPRWLAKVGLAPQRLAGWVGLAGPYDFLPIRNPDAQVAFNWPATAADTQPIMHVTAQAPSTLLLAAAEDDSVNPQRSTVGLARRLAAVGAPVRYKLFERLGHASLVAAMARPLNWLAPVLPEVLAFVDPATTSGG
ncbi:MAG TPA: alpha/beta hydrolase [Ramlibacter sp.]|nr:alpha/beta hydrolase [Ramlibacter sp.]